MVTKGPVRKSNRRKVAERKYQSRFTRIHVNFPKFDVETNQRLIGLACIVGGIIQMEVVKECNFNSFYKMITCSYMVVILVGLVLVTLPYLKHIADVLRIHKK